jgi:hypothetical protein
VNLRLGNRVEFSETYVVKAMIAKISLPIFNDEGYL